MKMIRVSLAAVLLVYATVTILAGLDIYQGTEPDLSSEWKIVVGYFILSLVLCLVTLFELARRNR